MMLCDRATERARSVMSSSKEPGISTDPDQTRPVALYKIIANQVLDECWQVIDEDEADNYTSLEVDDLGDEALLVFGRKTLKNLDWVAMIDQLTGLDLDYKGSEASAILFVKVDDNTYALTFGGGWRLLRSGKIDRDFGLNFALRALDADEIRHIKRLYFNAKSRVDINVVPAGQALWSFGIREHAELVRQITGKVLPASRVNLSHIRKMAKKRATRISIDCTERIRLPLPYSAAHLAEDLREVTRVLTSYKVDPELAPLQWIRRMTADETESLDDAWATLFELLDNFDDSVSLAYPARYHGGPEISRFMGQIGTHPIDTIDLTLQDIRDGIAGRDVQPRIRALKNGYINGYDEEGSSIGGDETALHWISGQVDLSNGRRLVLLDGDWYDLTDEYRRYVDRIVNDAFNNCPDWSLPAWNLAPTHADGRRDEQLYNSYVADTYPQFLCLDRKLIRTRVHKRGFEACDLLGPNNELVHVKKVSSRTGSGPLSHLFAQGIVAIESLTDLTTWNKLVVEVEKQDVTRADMLRRLRRPKALVYAIHRSDGLLTPDKLFTFAKSELASASILFAKLGIPLQICVIP